MNPAPQFSAWERSLAVRYLRAKKTQGGVALISIISFIGITLAVAVLISAMSVMNGFRVELLDKILGFNGHVYIVDHPLGPKNLTRMEVPGSPLVGWVRVTVSRDAVKPFAFEEYVVPRWKYW